MRDIKADVLKVIEALFKGLSLAKTLKNLRLSPSVFFGFLGENPEVMQTYNNAQQARAEMFVDEIVDISDDPEIDPFRGRLRIDTRKWYATKMQPTKYGDRIDLNINQNVDISAALLEAKKRTEILNCYPTTAVSIQPAQIIEHCPTNPPDAPSGRDVEENEWDFLCS
jgi:hypothetical protein